MIEQYYKCEKCGAVGNWKEFIENEMCCGKDEVVDFERLPAMIEAFY